MSDFYPTDEEVAEMRQCRCGSGKERFELVDIQGIFCTYVCDDCEKAEKAKYRPEMFTGYSQADVDEPIEPEEGIQMVWPADEDWVNY